MLFQDRRDDPEYDRILISFRNGYHLGYISQRKLGRVSLPRDPESFVAERDLGPDAMRIGRRAFVELLSGRRGMLKSTLMNQHVIAGLGNVYADEVLFQAQMHPETMLDRLGEGQLERLYHAMQDVLRKSVGIGADARDMPDDWLIGRRGAGEECPRCGAEIVRTKVNQRGTYHCPECQPKLS